MNKYQKALDRIKNVVVFNKNFKDYTNDLKVVQELVDRTVPYKPIYDRYFGYEFKCKCESHVDGHEEFCPNCGQVLDWSEE